MRESNVLMKRILLGAIILTTQFFPLSAQESGFNWGLQAGGNRAILVGENSGLAELGTQYETGLQGAANLRLQSKGMFWMGFTVFVTQWETSKLFQEREVAFRFRELGLRMPFGLRFGKHIHWSLAISGLRLSEGKVKAEDASLNTISNYRFLRTVDAGLYSDLSYELPSGWGLYVGAYHSLVNLSEVVPLQLRQLRWELGVRWWWK